MSHATVIKSFAELVDVLEADELSLSAEPETNGHVPPDNVSTAMPDLGALISELEAATGTLANIAQQEETIRARTMRDLERYDAVVMQQREAEVVGCRACEIRQRAEELASRSFTVQDRAAATHVAEITARVERGAEQLAKHCGQQRERSMTDPWLARALEERERQQVEEQARAAEAERNRRLASALAEARAALEAGQIEEATGLLGPLVKDNPNNPDVASLDQMIARYVRNVKSSETEEVLWEARRATRHDPATAVARLETVDVEGLPEPLARQVFGEWARACARLCRTRGIADPLRYAPNPGRGAVIAPNDLSGAYVVVSSLGMGPTWTPGSAVGDAIVQRARPLR